MPLKRKREDINVELRKKNQVIVNAIPEMLDATTNLGKGEIEIPKEIKEIEKKFKGKGYESFKKSLIKLLTDYFEPLRRKRKDLLNREVYVKEILSQGTKKAQILAQSKLEEARKKMGLR